MPAKSALVRIINDEFSQTKRNVPINQKSLWSTPTNNKNKQKTNENQKKKITVCLHRNTPCTVQRNACSVPLQWHAVETRQPLMLQHPPIFTAQQFSFSGPSLLLSLNTEHNTHIHTYTFVPFASWIIRSNHKVTNQSYISLGGYVTHTVY